MACTASGDAPDKSDESAKAGKTDKTGRRSHPRTAHVWSTDSGVRTKAALRARPTLTCRSGARLQEESAVDDEVLAGDPGRLVGEQEGGGAADVRRDPEPPQRVARGGLLLAS